MLFVFSQLKNINIDNINNYINFNQFIY